MSNYIMDLRSIVGHRPLLQVGASVIVEDNKGRILLQKRSDNHCWGYAGGSVELDEEVEVAAKRELYEETGLIANSLDMFGIFSGKDTHYIYPNGDEVSNVDIVFICKNYSGKLKRQEDEVEQLKFFDIEEVPKEISPPLKIALNKWIEGKEKNISFYNTFGGKRMNRLKLVLPTPEYKEMIMNYKREFIENGDSMCGAAGLENTETFEAWYSALCDKLKEETVREGLVPATTYMALSTNDNRLIGMINIRHRLNGNLLNFGGHIGYSIRKSERQQGYATEMLTLALIECSKFNIKKVLITCDKENVASAKTIIKNEGILENEIPKGNRITQRYWVTLE